MESIIETFHIDWQLLIAQVINFLIVLMVLWYLVLKPLMKMMEKRTETIEKSLEEARLIEENLKKAEEARVIKVMEAKKEAQKIIEQTNLRAEKSKEEMVLKAREEVNKIITQGKEQIAKDKEQMLKEVKSEIADLVILTTEKVLDKVLDKKLEKEIIEKSLREIK